jgi:hypothetical protein
MTINWTGTFRNPAASLVLNLSLMVCPAVFIAGSVLLTPAVSAQTRGTAQRVVHGRVEDKNGNGIKGAVVYLKDAHSASVKSAIAGDDGTYRFVQLSLNSDYEIWAQNDEHRSPTRSISSFDSKADITVFLKIDK